MQPQELPERRARSTSMNPENYQLSDIPMYWAPRMCAEETCLATATKTICAEPESCSDDICRQLVSCDAHADLLTEAVGMSVFGNVKPKITKVTAETYGRHD
jgi:hypothetical protein